MPAYRKFNKEDIWSSKVTVKPHIYYASSSDGTHALQGTITFQPSSPLDKEFAGWEAGNIQTEKTMYNQTGAVNLVYIDCTSSAPNSDDEKHRSVLNVLDWYFTRNGEYAPLSASWVAGPGGGPLGYDGFWHTSSLTADLNTTDLCLLDISNVYHGENIEDGSFFMFMDKVYDPSDVDRYYEWQGDEFGYIGGGVLIYVSSGSLFTGSASHIKWKSSGRLEYDISESVALSGSTSAKIGYMLPEGIGVITGKNNVASAINMAVGPGGTDTMILNIYGKQTIPVETLLCHARAAKCNASTNPSFYRSGSDGNMYLSGSNQSTVITKVGLYDENYDLVAVVGLSQPVVKNPDDDILIRVRLDL